MGLENLIEACARLRTSGAPFSLFIGGEGPLRPALEAQVRGAGLSDIISFLGRIPDETLPRWYAAADAFLLPTAQLECFGLVALEAMASGRPVLATPVGAIPEVVGRYEKEWLSGDASVSGLQELVGRFLAGSLPRWDPHRLHTAVVREFGREAVLPRLIAASLGRHGRT
jgi:glycosyltransferase involved in cell wall biosynthesis